MIGLILVATGCASAPPIRPGDPRYSPVMPVSQPAGVSSGGSIYASGSGLNLWEDNRARRIGDIITLLLEERTVSSKTNSTEIDKADTINMGVDSLLGTNPSMSLNGSTLNLGVQSNANREFEGDAASDQSNRLQGQISVTVVDVLPNGVLVVRGEKWMTFSQGDEFIRIEGLLRPSDVTPENTALSTRLADARLTYSGTGALADAQAQGWMSRFFNSRWWPF
ncbi:MAG: flagellar basal body L-ring protein FlgH [Pseudomonadota bacterium]|nr:flagellar basal body L-ring protein FlgH [Pseudomonadota bacterium]